LVEDSDVYMGQVTPSLSPALPPALPPALSTNGSGTVYGEGKESGHGGREGGREEGREGGLLRSRRYAQQEQQVEGWVERIRRGESLEPELTQGELSK
jgi:hypothetical protein